MNSSLPTKDSTGHIKATLFNPHGKVDMWLEDQQVHYQATGPFNRELVDCLEIAQLEFLQKTKPQGAWVSVCNVVDNAMSSPDGIARYGEIMAAPKPPGFTPIATAFVLAPDVEGARIMAPLFTRIYADINRPFRIFETMEQAQAWARSMLAEAEASGTNA